MLLRAALLYCLTVFSFIFAAATIWGRFELTAVREASAEMAGHVQQLEKDLDAERLKVEAAERRAMVAEEPEALVTNVRTMEEIVSVSLAPREFLTVLVAVFAAAALGLAMVGLYGVLTRLVRSRERELGIRRAIGAHQVTILGLVLKEGMGAVAAGAVAGAGVALPLGRALQSQLFGVTALDLPTYLVALGLLHLVAFLACYLPARRAARIDPTVALSSE